MTLYGAHMHMVGRMPDALSAAMGNQVYIACLTPNAPCLELQTMSSARRYIPHPIASLPMLPFFCSPGQTSQAA